MLALVTATLSIVSPKVGAPKAAIKMSSSRDSMSALDGSMVADYGFDPLNLANVDLNLGSASEKDRSSAYVLRDYREAELRHGRLAMLAALGWPVQELLNPTISRALREPLLLTETAGRSPSVLNGGLEQGPIPITLAVFALAIGAIDLYSLKLKEEQGEAWLPGDFGFDPLNVLGGASRQARRDMQAKEINNGRLAMIAVTIYVLEEAVNKAPITQITPWLFQPLFTNPAVVNFLNDAFSVASGRTG
mmetsp:Transcript_14968/g.38880  ORF Transcript_14968/g.38880 Transcript_14968/m.38880 type:complete len:248 (+) Transcript_14968:35-778(+)